MVPRGNFDGARLNQDKTMLTVHGTTEEFTDVVEMYVALVRKDKIVQPLQRVAVDSEWTADYENDESFADDQTVTLVGLGRTKANDAFAWQADLEIKAETDAADFAPSGEVDIDGDPPSDV